MTREDFIEELDKKNYKYLIEGERIVVSGNNSSNFIDLSVINLPSGVEFKDSRHVFLDFLKNIPSNTGFNNLGNKHSDVHMQSLFGGWFSEWEGNIQKIGHNRLLNKMVSLGLFDKESR
jgi:hypothetical protein